MSPGKSANPWASMHTEDMRTSNSLSLSLWLGAVYRYTLPLDKYDVKFTCQMSLSKPLNLFALNSVYLCVFWMFACPR